MLEINEEIIAKAKQAKSVEELITLAKEHDFELTEEKAVEYFEALNQKTGELSDEELENVAGGGCEMAGEKRCCSCKNWIDFQLDICPTCGNNTFYQGA